MSDAHLSSNTGCDSSKDWLTPEQRVGRIIGDLTWVMSEMDQRHNAYRVMEGVRRSLFTLKAALPEPPAEAPAAHRAGVEPISRLAGDIDYCLTKIDPMHDVHKILSRVSTALRVTDTFAGWRDSTAAEIAHELAAHETGDGHGA